MHNHGIEQFDPLLILLAAWEDTYLMLPVLFALYVLLEYLSHKRGLDLLAYSNMTGKLGPIAGTLLGLIPQCGMSVFVTSLYVTRRVTLGTLIATYIATSDEAFPVLIAHSGQFGSVAMIIGLKTAFGIGFGYLIDAVMPEKFFKGEIHSQPASRHVAEVITELKVTPYGEILKHAFHRTVRIYLWVFAFTVLLVTALAVTGLPELFASLRVPVWLEILVTGAFGLIPNCASSIAVAEAYLHSIISFPAAMAGLCANAGFGPLVLFKDGNFSVSIKLFIITYVSSVVAGLLIYGAMLIW